MTANRRKLHIPESILKKYLRKGPRYTSYPPANWFRKDIDVEEFVRAWKGAGEKFSKGISLYVHVPFCSKRCYYCGCHTTTQWDEGLVERYASALVEEMYLVTELVDATGEVFQVAFGGGTPNTLADSTFERVFNALRGKFTLHPSSEISIECDPRIMDENRLDFLVSLGFNRFSFGVQDFNPVVQSNVGRQQDEGKIRSLIEHLRKRNIRGINIDLIYGLPGQSLNSFAETINKVISIKPSRIAIFGYAHVPWLHPHQRQIESFSLPSSELRAGMVELSSQMLEDAGYIHVGLDHYALEDDELAVALKLGRLHRNFMGYTTKKGEVLVAFGASAISDAYTAYMQGNKDIRGYMKTIIDDGVIAWNRGFILSQDDIIRREIILQLFCNLSVDIGEIGKKFGIDGLQYFASEIEKLLEMERDGLVEVSGGRISLTPVGSVFVRNVCMVFDRYVRLSEGRQVHSETL